MKPNLTMMQDMLSESPRCNDMAADLHFPRFFGTAIQCEIARHFPRSVVKVGLQVQCKNIEWGLRVRTFFHKTVRVCHVYCNFKIGFTCRITIILEH